MGYLPPDLPAMLRGRGLTVHERAGWQRFGAATLRPAVIVVHDDIIGGCPTSLPGIIPGGRPDLPGPLYNLWIECDGDVHIVAGGVANNAGRGSWAGYTGNSRTIGMCRSHHPDGGAHGGTPEQNASASVVCAVLADLYGIPAANVIGHKEWTSRKPDPWHLDMGAFRSQVAAGGQEDDMTPEQAAKLDQVHAALLGKPGGLPNVLASVQSAPLMVVWPEGKPRQRWVTDGVFRWKAGSGLGRDAQEHLDAKLVGEIPDALFEALTDVATLAA